MEAVDAMERVVFRSCAVGCEIISCVGIAKTASSCTARSGDTSMEAGCRQSVVAKTIKADDEGDVGTG